MKGYKNKANREREERAFYWRETFALLCNINRGENTEPISGEDVYPLEIDKYKAPAKPSDDILRMMQELTKRMNDGN